MSACQIVTQLLYFRQHQQNTISVIHTPAHVNHESVVKSADTSIVRLIGEDVL